jgi:hypothetical protein
MIVRKRLNSYAILLKSAMETGMVSQVYNAINESDDGGWILNKNLAHHQRFQASAAAHRQAEEEAERKKPKPQPSNLPEDVPGLSKMLGDVIDELMAQHGVGEDQVNKLVSQAIHNAKYPPDVTNGPGFPGGDFSKMGDSKPLGPVDVSGMMSGGYGDDPGDDESEEEHPDGHPEHPGEPATTTSPGGSAAAARTVQKPEWYGQMTNAERAWFDKLSVDNPEAAQQYVAWVNMRHTGKNDYLEPGSEDWHQAQIIADRTHKRNPWMQDRDATFRASAGLLGRQKVRQKLAKLYGKGGDWEGEAPPLDDFDHLLHQDHKKNPGNFMNEWCYLAGVKEEKKKPKRRGR